MQYLLLIFLTVPLFYLYEKSYITINNKKANFLPFFLFSFLVVVLFSGLRYEVGTDYNSYREMYEGTRTLLYREIGFRNLFYLLQNLNLEYYHATIILALITNLFIFLKVKNSSKYGFLAISIYLLDGNYFQSFNIMAQYISIALFFYATKYIVNKNFLKYFLFIIIGALFHKSMLLILPVYFLPQYRFKKTTYILGIITSYILVQLNLIERTTIFILSHIDILGYSSYINSNYFFMKSNLGFGVLFLVILCIIIILFNDKIFKNKEQLFYFNLYYIGMIFRLLSGDARIFVRVGGYFYIFSLLAIPKILDLFKRQDEKIIVSIGIIILFIIFNYQRFFFPDIWGNYQSIFG